jgi:hypothetical protein
VPIRAPAVRQRQRSLTVHYGHPGVFVYAGHQSIERLREQGYDAVMLPAISSIDCMFTDLGFDPAWDGRRIHEATRFLTRNRIPDTCFGLILLQVGSVGDAGFSSKGFDGRNLPVLSSYLEKFYGPDYEVVVYQAAQFAISNPVVRIVKIKDLAPGARVGVSTLYVPPLQRAATDRNVRSLF